MESVAADPACPSIYLYQPTKTHINCVNDKEKGTFSCQIFQGKENIGQISSLIDGFIYVEMKAYAVENHADDDTEKEFYIDEGGELKRVFSQHTFQIALNDSLIKQAEDAEPPESGIKIVKIRKGKIIE